MNSLTGTVFAVVLAAAPVLAAAHQNEQGQGPRGMPMMTEQDLDAMGRNMARMHELMEEAEEESDPAKRQQLLREHMDQMYDYMGSMHRGMWGGGMMGPGAGGQHMMPGPRGQGMMQQQGGSAPQGNLPRRDQMSPDERLHLMEDRLDQMQLMMEQMLENQRQQRR